MGTGEREILEKGYKLQLDTKIRMQRLCYGQYIAYFILATKGPVTYSYRYMKHVRELVC